MRTLKIPKKYSPPDKQVSVLMPKHKAFLKEWIKDFNATEAYIRAGLPHKTRAYAQQASFQIMSQKVVQDEIKRLMDNLTKKTEVTVEKIIKELHLIATSDVGILFNKDSTTLKNIHEMPELERRAISSIEVEELYHGHGENRTWVGYIRKVKFWEKTKSLELLGKYLAMWVERKIEAKGELNDTAFRDEFFGVKQQEKQES